ncbi:MAG: glutamine--fructose-6-phosphate transaminase (isomerizing) [Myxococcota bacterium]|nr:glutamine--fructose-6-phosphate transaminase (isomerizing) [Myxococcota bacterium]
MCGIVGYLGSEDACSHVLEGLQRLEYRGYDSAGIATLVDGKLAVRRRKGKLLELRKLLAAEPLVGSVAVGHTRWATHGRPSDDNAHPHHAGDVVVVHNGIIENFLELKGELGAEGCEFSSETDTEIVAHLVAQATGDSLEERVRKALKRVRGAYAIAVLSEREPGKLVVAKNASPLVIGYIDDGGMVASDIPALLPYTRDVLVMEEGELAVLEAGSVKLSTIDGEPVDRHPRRIDWSPVMAEKGGHKHFMHKEIHEQPRAIVDTIRGRITDNSDVNLSPELLDAIANADRVMLTACGTSWHACLVGRLALEELARLGCEVELASELRYRHPLMGPKSVTIAVSQSGETADTLAAIKEAKRLGSPVIAVVNVLDSSIAREADFTIYTHAGPEIGVASTKAFITQVAALVLMAVGVGSRRGLDPKRASTLLEQLRLIPLQIEAIIKNEKHVVGVAHKVAKASSALFLGRGYGFPVALEGALKLKEISYIHAEGYAAGEMKHGPIALIEPGLPVVSVVPSGRLYEKTVSNMQEVRAREGYVIAIATEGNDHIETVADEVIFVPDCDPVLMPLLATIPLQLLSYHVADIRGTDIDQPRNLAKSVTVE